MDVFNLIASACLLLALTERSAGMVETVMPTGHMVCRPLSEWIGELAGGEKSTNKSIIPSSTGPKGPPGPIGAKGFPGPRGETDLKVVDKTIEERTAYVEARIKKLEDEYADLEKNGIGTGSSIGFVPPTMSSDEVKNAIECMKKHKSPITDGTTCYSIIGGEGLQWDFHSAESNCTKLGGYPADLNSRAVYDKIYDFVDSTYSTEVQAWTGMRYENDNLLLTTGKSAEFTKWIAFYPRSTKTSYSSFYKSYSYIYAKIDTSSRTNGLKNQRSTMKLSYAICQFELSPDAETRRSTTKEATTPSPRRNQDYFYRYNY